MCTLQMYVGGFSFSQSPCPGRAEPNGDNVAWMVKMYLAKSPNLGTIKPTSPKHVSGRKKHKSNVDLRRSSIRTPPPLFTLMATNNEIRQNANDLGTRNVARMRSCNHANFGDSCICGGFRFGPIITKRKWESMEAGDTSSFYLPDPRPPAQHWESVHRLPTYDEQRKIDSVHKRLGELSPLDDTATSDRYGNLNAFETVFGDFLINSNEHFAGVDYVKTRTYAHHFYVCHLLQMRNHVSSLKWNVLRHKRCLEILSGESDRVPTDGDLLQVVREVLENLPPEYGVEPQSWPFSTSLTDASDNVARLTETLQEVASNGIKTKHDFDFNEMIKTYLVLALGTSAIIFTHKREYFLALLSSVGALLVKSDDVMVALRDFQASMAVNPQAGEASIEPLVQLCIMALGLKSVIKGSTRDLCTTVSSYTRFSEGGVAMFGDALGMLEKIVNCLRVRVFGLDVIKFFDEKEDEIQSWMNDVDKLEAVHEARKLPIDVHNYDKVMLLKGLGDRFFREVCRAGREFSSLKAMVVTYQRKLSDILLPFKRASLDSSALRAPPLSILLQGESGVGKSALTIPFIDDMLFDAFDDPSMLKRYAENNMDFIYCRNYETKFWDGYRGQHVCVFDDFMQNVNVTGDPDGEEMNIVRGVNSFPYNLHMAHVEDKGINYFTSKLILATTNDYDCHSMLIKKQEALKRRFDIIAHVVPKLEFCVDPNPHQTLFERRLRQMDHYDDNVYEFHIKECGIFPTHVNHILCYKEFLALATRAYSKRMSVGNRYIADIGARRKNRIDAKLTQLGVVVQCGKEKVDAALERLMINPDPEQAKLIMTLRFADLLAGHGDEFMRGFWDSTLGFVTLLNNTSAFKQNSDVLGFFIDNFRKHCENKGVLCVLTPKNVADRMRPEFVPVFPQSGGHACSRNIADFIVGFDEFERGDVTEDNAVSIVSDLLNDGAECHCAHFSTAVELVMSSSWNNKSTCRKLLDKAKGLFRKENTLPILAGVAGALVVMKSIHSIYKLWNDNSVECDSVAQYHDRDVVPKARALRSYKMSNVVKVQSGNDAPPPNETCVKFIDSLVTRNVYVCYTKGVAEPWAFMTAIGKDVFMLNAHYYRLCKRRLAAGRPMDIAMIPMVNVLHGDLKNVFHLNLANIVNFYPPTAEMIEHDAWLFRVTNMRPHRDISHNFISEDELGQYKRRVPVVSAYLRSSDGENMLATQISDANIVRQRFDNDELHMRSYLTTTFQTESGDCGSLVICHDSAGRLTKIVGMHAALKLGVTALATCVTREFVLANQPRSMSVLPVGVDPEFEYDQNGLLEIPAPHVYHRPTKTKLRKSPFHGVFGEPKRDVATLAREGEVDPYELAIARYGTGNFHVDETVLNAAQGSYLVRIKSSCGGARDILSMEEAIKGIDGEPYINGLCRKTSPGYPWNLCGTGGKWHLFGDAEEYNVTGDEAVKLMERCSDIIEKAKCGIRLEHYYIDALKDELRPLEKVLNSKTRMISCAPTDLVVVMKMYFGSFVSSFYKGRILNGSAVGINATSREWTTLARYLNSRGGAIVAGDFSSFDATQSATTLRSVLGVINTWYSDGEENAKIREILWMEVLNSLHLHGGKALMFDHSLPSGNPLTTVINTIYVNLVMRMAFVYAYNNVSVLEQFDEHVALVAFGDDNIMGISAEALEDFNYQTIGDGLSRLGLIYTSEDKTVSDRLSKSLEECTFLKRGFVEEDGTWKAPLDIDVVSEMWYWYRHGTDARERVQENIESMLRELSIHPKSVWDMYVPTIEKETRAKGYDLISYDYDFYTRSADALYQDVKSRLGPIDLRQDMDDLLEAGFSNMAVKVQSGSEPATLAMTNLPDDGGPMRIESQLAGQPGAEDEVNDTTQFVDDTEVRSYEIAPYSSLTETLTSAPSVNNQDYVKAFLARPIHIDTINFATTSAAGDTLYAHILPNNDFYASTSTLWSSKLQGFMGIRATAVFRFVVAANRFVQGRVLIHFLPGHADIDWEKAHNRNLMTRSQQPRIEINVNRDTAAEIRFPYIAPSTHYNLLTFEGRWGRLFATVYSPLIGSVGNLDINVYLHFEDVELVVPTVVQSGRFKEREQLGPVSGPLDVSSKVATALSHIPSLSAIAKPAAWFLSYAKRTAQSFGYSVANNADHFLRVMPACQGYSMTNDGQRVAFPMANSSKNEVDVLSGFAGNDIDEMSLEYFVQRPAYVATYTLLASNPTGFRIATMPVGPSAYQLPIQNYAASHLPGVMYTMAPVTLVAGLTTQWRGSLVFNFKFVKTEFHTGKIAFVFVPGVLTAINYSQTNWLFRQIVDIKDTDEVHITVPYTALTPWTLRNEYIGSLQFFVVNPLNAPPTVSSSIDIILEVAGGEDFAVSGLSGMSAGAASQQDFTPQSGLFKEDTRIKSFTIGGAIIKPRNLDAERYCIGEAMTSVKHFTNKFTRCLGGSVAQNNPTIANCRTLVFKPFTIGGFITNGATVTVQASSMGGTYMDIFSSCYSIARGSMYFDLYSTDTTNWIQYSFNSKEANGSYSPYEYGTLAAGIVPVPNNQVVIDGQASATAGHVVISVPQWSIGHSRYTRCDNTDGARLKIPFEPQLFVTLSNPIANVTYKRSRMYKATGDDYQLGGFVGVPALYVLGTYQVPAPLDINA